MFIVQFDNKTCHTKLHKTIMYAYILANGNKCTFFNDGLLKASESSIQCMNLLQETHYDPKFNLEFDPFRNVS